jgi:hypothetical protein
MGKYHIFLSCEDDILIENENLEIILKRLLSEGRTIDIKCIKKHTNLELSKEDLDDLFESSIYVVNTHKDLDYITSWELGYAMGKGLKIIGYFDGNNTMEIPTDVEGLIRPIPSDVTRFVEMINRALEKLEPKEYPLEEEGWNKQHQSAKKEAEATL